jgi:hypothetical protein
MPAVLTAASSLQCVHGGTITVTAGQQLLTAAGNPVLVQADLVTATITGCANTNAQLGQKPCLKITSLLVGASTTLSVSSQPVLLETARGLTDAIPPLPVLWQVAAAGQTVLEAR